MTAPGDRSLSVHTATGPVLVQIGGNAPGTKGLSIQTEAGQGIIPVHGIAPGDRVISMQTATGQVLVPVTATTPDVMGDICLAGSERADTNGATIYRSTNGGLTWSAVYSDTAKITEQFQSIKIRGSVALAGTWGAGGLLRSVDYGATWDIIVPYDTDEAFAGYMALEFISDSVVLAGVRNGAWTGGKIVRSTDAGLTWSTVATFDDYASCGGLAYVGGGICIAGISNKAAPMIYRSYNYGVTWSKVADIPGYPQTAAYCIIDYVGKGTVFAGVGYLYRSVDAGASWSTVSSGPSSGQFTGVIHVGSGVCFAGGYNTLTQKSIDWGATWEDHAATSHVKGIEYIGGGCVLIASPYGISRSTDYGENYTNVLSARPMNCITSNHT